MGNVTIGLDDETEETLRQLAKERHRGGKGALAKTVKEGVDQLKKASEKEKAWQRILTRIKKGYHLGGLTYSKREELYDRR